MQPTGSRHRSPTGSRHPTPSVSPHSSSAGVSTRNVQRKNLESRISLQQIWPLPKHESSKPRKRKAGESIIFTSSPNKAVLDERNSKTKFTAKTQKTKKKVRVVTDKRDKLEEKHPKYFCLFCDEAFTDPPDEDWIMCLRCFRWSNESCTDYDIQTTENYCCDRCR